WMGARLTAHMARDPFSTPSVLGFWGGTIALNCNDYSIAATRLDGGAQEIGPDGTPPNRRLPVGCAALRDHPGAPQGLHLPLHRLPAHDQQRLLARLRASGRGLPLGSRRTEGSPAHDRQRPRVDPLGLRCGVWVCTAPKPGTTVRNMRGGTLDD